MRLNYLNWSAFCESAGFGQIHGRVFGIGVIRTAMSIRCESAERGILHGLAFLIRVFRMAVWDRGSIALLKLLILLSFPSVIIIIIFNVHHLYY